ncbi:sensor domain-containing diguanylate cyclase [Glaciimonas immobilis]|uniref:diguanylate cyclase n=1 Tax=Glaciimonas immobilis TaxID=728004 RepID=A0A840RQT8_9BURK|nr:diguanylate cyclase [Glaciimonas immobilis]KAF3999457.1 diguanylate cyclase [Glaciimonas immobilis]MBB5198971.1 diguanylate cyclase (GGDEF)-like protein [Glaciimonas immobilis]
MKNKNAAEQVAKNILKNEEDRSFAIRLMQHLVVPTFVLDPQCKVVIWNIACERLTGIAASEMIGTSNHWRGFYSAPRPCLADLIVHERTSDVNNLYIWNKNIEKVPNGLYAENWCVMPQLGIRRYLAIDAGPIYDETGRLISVVETLRDMTVQKEAQDALKDLATRDGLTGIANRRSFDEALDSQWSRALRKSDPLTLLMVDVDNFKQYNDRFGHQAGDDCLKRVATAMANTPLRAYDLVARYGGEEFAVILPGVTSDGAQAVAERIRAAVEQLSIADTSGGFVTVSVGAATVNAIAGCYPGQLVAAADASLYQAKHRGRNRVVAMNVDTMDSIETLPNEFISDVYGDSNASR